MRPNNVIRLYLLMLILHQAHVFEEVWGYSWIVNLFNSVGKFLAINWVLYSISVIILYFILQKRIAGYQLGMLYSLLMILSGVLHITGYLVTSRYFGGFAGALSSLGIILIGIPLFISLRRALPILQW